MRLAHQCCLSFLMLAALTAAEDFPLPQLNVPILDAYAGEFAPVLAAIAKPDGVDYAALRGDHQGLDRFVVQVAQASAPTERQAKIAFYVNAYNAAILSLVHARLPADQRTWRTWSIEQLGTAEKPVWKAVRFLVAGERLSLDEIENVKLRPLGEPRIHFALNCASRSCPPLAPEPYRVITLDAQLEQASRAFVNSAYHIRLVQGKLLLNPILDWFAADFTAGGEVRAFLRARIQPGLVAEALTTQAPFAYFTYDWSLNLAGEP